MGCFNIIHEISSYIFVYTIGNNRTQKKTGTFGHLSCERRKCAIFYILSNICRFTSLRLRPWLNKSFWTDLNPSHRLFHVITKYWTFSDTVWYQKFVEQQRNWCRFSYLKNAIFWSFKMKFVFGVIVIILLYWSISLPKTDWDCVNNFQKIWFSETISSNIDCCFFSLECIFYFFKFK